MTKRVFRAVGLFLLDVGKILAICALGLGILAGAAELMGDWMQHHAGLILLVMLAVVAVICLAGLWNLAVDAWRRA